MKYLKYLLLIFFIFQASSCSKILYLALAPQQANPERYLQCYKDECRSVVFIPMVHIAKPKFYKEVKNEVTKLKSKGYKVFYESVSYPKNIDSLSKDTLQRKMRKLIGMRLQYGINSKELPNFLRNGNYIMKNAENMGLSKEEDFNVDLNIEEIISGYQEEYGSLKLSDCDWETDLEEEYLCEKASHSNYAIETIRNDYISDRVLDSDHKKIVMLYGKLHKDPIMEELYEAGFRKVDYQ